MIGIGNCIVLETGPSGAGETNPTLRPSAIGIWDPELSVLARQDVGGGSNPSGLYVASMTDLSSHGRTVTTTLIARPQYSATACNGHPGIVYAGAQQLAALFSGPGQPITRVFVINKANVPGAQQPLGGDLFPNGANTYFGTFAGQNDVEGNAGGGAATTFTLVPATTYAVIQIFNGASSQVYVEGVAGTAASIGTAGDTQGFAMGSRIDNPAALAFSGSIGFAADYAEIFDAGTLAAFFSYLGARYA